MTVATAMPVAPVKNGNQAIESWLDGHGLTYSQRNIKLSQIDRQSSLRNQARIGAPLNDDQVVMYAAAMENGDVFPPVVVYQQSEAKKYIVIDGNHRVAAYDLLGAVDSIDVYVIDKPSHAQITTLTYEANTKHGLPTSIQERLRQAVLLVEQGATQRSAAKSLGVPEPRVQAAVQVRRGDKRAGTLGLPKRWYDLSNATRRMLSQIRNDNHFKAAAELAIVTKMGSNDAARLAMEVRGTRTETEGMKLIQKWYDERKEDIRVTAGGRVAMSPRLAQYNTAVRKITHIQVSEIKDIDMGSDLKARLRLNTVNAMSRMNEILEVLR